MSGEDSVRSVLFVDDEQPNRDLFSRALTSAGFDVDVAEDGNKAIAKLEKRPYDAIVIDVIMPNREGIESIIQIRKRWANLFVIAISGGGRLGADDVLSLAAAVGADQVLKKPFRPAQLVEMLSAGRSKGAA